MPSIRFDKFTAELASLYRPPVRQPATWTKLKQALAEFAAVPGVRTSADLTAVNVAAWLAAHPGRSPATAHSLLRSLRAACRYARKAGHLRADPFEWRSPAEWVDSEPEAETRDRHRSAAEIARLLRLLDGESAGGSWEAGRLQALVYTLAYTGMRKREALGLRVEDVDQAGRVILLKSHPRRKLKTKGSAAPMAIAHDLAAVLRRWLPRCGGSWVFPGKKLEGPWLGGGPGVRALDQVRAAGERAGIRGLTILDFRHTVGTLAEGWGVGELELQRWLRHTRRRTQDAYRKRGDMEAIRRTAEKISYPEVPNRVG